MPAPTVPVPDAVSDDEPSDPAALLAELRAARQALHDRAQQVNLIEELAGLGSWEIDLGTDQIRWSREQCRLHGVSEVNAPATHAAFRTMVHVDDRDLLDRGMAELLDGEPRTVEFRLVRPDGAVRRMRARARLVRDASGQQARIVGTTLDVTERRDAERLLQEREALVARLERLADMGSWEMDMTSGRITWSTEQLRIHGLPLDQPNLTEEQFLALVHPDDRPRIVDVMTRLVQAGEPFHVAYRIVRPDGEVRYLEAPGQMIPGPDGPLSRMIGLSRDVTERRMMDEALRASADSYRTIFENVSNAVWLHDLDTGQFLEVNQAACEFNGYSVEEHRTIGLAGTSVGYAPYRPEDAFVYVARAAAGQPQQFEWKARHKAGHEVWTEIRLRRVRVGGVDRILATGTDIGERKRAEEALREANEALERRVTERTAQLRETQRLARVGSWQWDSATNVLALDAALCDVYGITPETAPRDLAGYLEHVHPDDRALVEDVAARVLATGEPFAYDHRIRTPDGAIRHVHWRGSVTRDANGQPVRVTGSGQDITERKEAELALAEREAHFRRIIETANDFVMICDMDGQLTFASPSSTRLLGYAPEEMLGQQPVHAMHPDDAEEAGRLLREIFAHPGRVYTTRHRMRHRSGDYRVFEFVARTLSADSPADGMIAFARDVTDRTLAEAALAQAKEEAERANRAKSEFLSRMSHELRTPMNSILGFAQLLSRAELVPAQAKGVQHILKAGRHLLHLINEVLEISRIEAGREHFSLEPVALPSVLREAVGLVRPLAQQHGVALSEAPGVEEAFVHADRQRLVQVLLNLLSNAIKYNRDGGTVRIGYVRHGQASERWAVRVEDSGRGIPAQRVSELFTPFARLGAEQSDVEGTGLGLALSRRLCEAMGGGLTLERSGAEGSVFRVELGAATDPLTALEITGSFDAVEVAHGAATLLYVEDNLANLSLVETILLARPQWRVLPALQGGLGVELAREHRPDLVLLDLHLPDMSGSEVLRRLRADPRTAEIPVVIVSADATPSSVERLRQAGADAYLTKPIDVDEFLRVVGEFVPMPGTRSEKTRSGEARS